MAQAPRDQNFVPTLLAVSSTDGTTPVAVYADPTTHRLLTSAAGGAAPSDATYVTLTTNATLTNERVLTGTANQITITDNGAGSTVVLSLPQSIATTSTPTFASMTLTAGSSLTLGTASTATGAIVLKNATNANTTTIQSGVAGASIVFTLPTTDGNASDVLQTDGAGVLSWVPASVAIGGTVTSGTAGSVLWVDTGPVLAQDNTNFYWDKTNLTLSIGGVDTMTVNGAAVTARLVGHASDTATSAVEELHQHSNTAGRGAVSYFARSRGTLGAPLVVASGDSIGQIDAVAYDGTDYATMASIEFEVDGTPGANDMPGRIIFKTSPDGSQTLTEAFRLSQNQAATFAGTVTMPTPFTLGATSVTTTGTQLNYLNAATGTTGTTSTNVVFSTSPTLVTPVLGAATATSINGLTITSSTGTLTITNAKTLSVSNSLTLAGTDSTTMTFPTTSATIARTDAAQTFTGVQSMTSPDITTSITTPSTTFSIANATATTVNFAGAATTMAIGASTALITVGGNLIHSSNAITATANAATVPITHRLSTVTNNSAATLTITMTTTSAVDGQLVMVRILDFSAVAQTITWVNTENSTVTAPTTSNGSTTLPLTVGFQYNSNTSKWRCIASA